MENMLCVIGSSAPRVKLCIFELSTLRSTGLLHGSTLHVDYRTVRITINHKYVKFVLHCNRKHLG